MLYEENFAIQNKTPGQVLKSRNKNHMTNIAGENILPKNDNSDCHE